MSTFAAGRNASLQRDQHENAYLISHAPQAPPQQFASSAARSNGSAAVRNFLLKKSASLRAPPPPVVLPARHSVDAGDSKGAALEESPEDDTVSSGLSGESASCGSRLAAFS